MKARAFKYLQCMQVTWSNFMVYKTNFILQVIAPLFVFLFVKVSVWSSVYQSAGKQAVGGYDYHEMIAYHLWILIVTLITLSQSGQEISLDIRMGRISTYLIYPFTLFEFHLAKFFAGLSVKILVAFVTLTGAMALAGIQVTLGSFVKGLALSLVASLFWFLLNYFFGLIAFWLEETWTFTVMVQVITYFFSGAVIPLELYPEWVQGFLHYSPFPYIGFIPAKIFMGQNVDLGEAFLILGFWIAFWGLCIRWVWQKGLTMYTASGM